MTVHYHGLPITPARVLEELGGLHYCVSWYRSDQISQARRLGQGLMLDNGAFSFWRAGRACSDWRWYYRWVEKWINPLVDFWIIPDVIGGSESENDDLLARGPLSLPTGVPVWHLNESYKRLHSLTFRGNFERVAFGSTAEYPVLSDAWKRRVDDAFNVICDPSGRVPIKVHMLRGLKTCGMDWPWASADSSSLGRNHHRGHVTAKDVCRHVDSVNCPSRWHGKWALPAAFERDVCLYDQWWTAQAR
jgi:hypothetical protein